MNRIANSPRSPAVTPVIVARFDLSDENQLLTQDFMRRAHTGRWPLWLMLGLRQVGSIIYEAAQWRPTRKRERPEYVLLRWEPAVVGVSWQKMPSKRAALSALRAST